MALSRIWSIFILIGITVATIKFAFTANNSDVFNRLVVGKQGDTSNTQILDSTKLSPVVAAALQKNKEYKQADIKFVKLPSNQIISYREQTSDGIITTCKNSVDIAIGLIGVMALFMGFMSIAEAAGGIRILSKWMGPLFTRIFPEVPKGHPAFGHMSLNFAANLLGLDNAATPFGLKAMQSLQDINPSQTTASNAQVMFMGLHASGLTLIPVSIIAVRSKMGAANPTDIFIPCMITTFAATVASLLIVSFKQKINLLQPVILLWLGTISAFVIGLVMYFSTLSKAKVELISGVMGNGILLFIFAAIILGGMYKKINLFDAFFEGAKDGFSTAVRLIPYFVGMLVAISLLRTSGTFDMIIGGFKQLFASSTMDTRWIDGLPNALLRPFSGPGARGLMIDTMKTYGVDSFPARLSGVIQGSNETTFYVIAVYYGAVNIKNIRYSLSSMLLADLVGLLTAIGLSYLFFG